MRCLRLTAATVLAVFTLACSIDLTQSGATAGANDNVTVYITKTGDKYHTATCSYLRDSKIPISLGEAKRLGYTPCSRCNPPRVLAEEPLHIQLPISSEEGGDI